MSLIQMSLSGGLLILVTIVIRALAVHRLPKGVMAALWGVACARLLIPFVWTSKWSLYGLFSASKARVAAGAGPTWTVVEGTQAGLNPATVSAGGTAAFPISVWTLIYLAGALGCALWFGAAFIKSRKRFRESLPVESPAVERWMGAHRLRRKVQVRVSDRIAAPLTYGLWAPVILLPRNMERMEAHQIGYILEHEWTHIQRLDALYKVILAVCGCIHWFNPLVWVMIALANRDIELSADERVVRALDVEERKAYLYTLIQMEERKSGFAPFCSNFSKNALEERIVAVMKMKNKSVMAMVLALALMLGAGAAFATSAPQVEVSAPAAEAVEGDGNAMLDPLEYQQTYAQYEPFGLSYNESDGRLYYQGKKVRNFEDLYPIDTNSSAGTVYQMPDGEVDVRAIRELNDPIKRNADGSFDPSGRLVGLEALSRQEFDQRTREQQERSQEETVYVYPMEGTADAVETVNSAETVDAMERSADLVETAGSTETAGATEGTADNVETAGDGTIDPEVFQEYLSFGLEISDGALYFQGKRVRNFDDTYTSGWRTISVQNYDEQGEIDVKAVREGEKLVDLVGIEAVG